MIHTCGDCGLVHDGPASPGESAEVAIARIQADAAVRQAEINARADRHIADTQAEAAVEVAAEEAGAVEDALADQEADEHVVDAINAAAVGLAETDAEPPAEPPVIVQADAVAQNDEAPPVVEHDETEEKSKKRGLGAW